jgi:hypothetical protein
MRITGNIGISLLLLFIFTGAFGGSILGSDGQGDYVGASWVGGSGSDHSVAEYESQSGLWVNPAELALKERLNFGIRLDFEDTNTTDIKSKRFTALGISSRLPIGLNVGIMAAEELDFSYVTDYQPIYLSGQDDPIGRRRIESSGKLYSISLGAAVALEKNYFFGFSYNRYTGSAQTRFANHYDSDEFSDSSDTIKDSLHGDNITIGLMKRISDKLMFGTAFRTTARFEADTSVKTGDELVTQKLDADFEIPQSASISARWEAFPDWNLIPSVSYFWSGDSSAPRSDVEFVNTTAYKLMVEHSVEESTLWPSIQIPLRLGYEFRHWNFLDYNGSRIPVHTFSIGTSHKARNRRIKIDALYSKRGGSSHEPFNEDLFQVRVSFQIGELMDTSESDFNDRQEMLRDK